MNNKEPNLSKKDWKIYNALKELIVGEEEYQAKTLIIMINNYYGYDLLEPGNDRMFRYHIRRLRRSSLITRTIKSTRNGYSMPIEEEKGISLIGARALNTVETCFLSGDLHPDQVFELANRYRDMHHAMHGQGRLKVGTYTNEEVHRNSKDLVKGE